jgi:hypothetical protein
VLDDALMRIYALKWISTNWGWGNLGKRIIGIMG